MGNGTHRSASWGRSAPRRPPRPSAAPNGHRPRRPVVIIANQYDISPGSIDEMLAEARALCAPRGRLVHDEIRVDVSEFYEPDGALPTIVQGGGIRMELDLNKSGDDVVAWYAVKEC